MPAARVRPGADRAACGRVRALTGALDDYLRELEIALRAVARGPAGAARLRERRDLQGGAAAVRAARRRGRSDRVRARRRQHQRGLRLHAHGRDRASACARAATTSASRSTATATACWRSTRDGTVVDGDEIIAEIALDLKRRGELTGNGVAVTVMTNFGFHQAMRRGRHRGRDDGRRRPARRRGAVRPRTGCWAASSPGTSSTCG